jgi:hypothetical protein
MDADLGSRVLYVISDALDEERHVIEEIFGGEYTIRLEGNSRGDAVEPLRS